MTWTGLQATNASTLGSCALHCFDALATPRTHILGPLSGFLTGVVLSPNSFYCIGGARGGSDERQSCGSVGVAQRR